MKRTAFISAVILITLSIQSCRQLDESISPVEAATLKKVQDSSKNLSGAGDTNIIEMDENAASALMDGEIAPPPKK